MTYRLHLSALSCVHPCRADSLWSRWRCNTANPLASRGLEGAKKKDGVHLQFAVLCSMHAVQPHSAEREQLESVAYVSRRSGAK
eukprot:3626388-Pleurochrysis_carterae.AAC.2